MTPKIIKSLEEFRLVTQVCLHKMGEPGLEQKVSETFILSDKEFEEEYLKINPTYDPKLIEAALDPVSNIILLRESPFRKIFPAYMHELGHFATYNEISILKQRGLAGEKQLIFWEAIAYAFEGYAKEKYNEIEKGYFLEVTSKIGIQFHLETSIEFGNLKDAHTESKKLLLNSFQASGLDSYETLYPILKKLPTFEWK